MTDRNERIQRRAHDIWEREGRPHGRHDEHWSLAEAEIRAEEQTGGPAGEAGKAPRRRTKGPADKAKEMAAGKAAKPKASRTAAPRAKDSGTRAAAENLSAVAAGRTEQTGTTKTGGQISRGGAARGKSAKASRKDASPG